MLIKFFNHGKGSGEGPTNYLMSEKDHKGVVRSVAPVVLFGDVEGTKDLINTLDFAHKYTCGSLNFEEDNIHAKQKAQIMESFEECLFPGMERNQYDILWIEHRDKGRLELNFLIPNVELTTGKNLKPYYEAADLPRVDAWKKVINASYNFADPDDPARKQKVTKIRLPASVEATRDLFTKLIITDFEKGDIKSRDDVLAFFEKMNFEVVRVTPKGISIKNPNGERNIRFKGFLFSSDFNGDEEGMQRVEKEWAESKDSRLADAKELYLAAREKRQSYLTKRYSPPEIVANKKDFRPRELKIKPTMFEKASFQRKLTRSLSAVTQTGQVTAKQVAEERLARMLLDSAAEIAGGFFEFLGQVAPSIKSGVKSGIKAASGWLREKRSSIGKTNNTHFKKETRNAKQLENSSIPWSREKRMERSGESERYHQAYRAPGEILRYPVGASTLRDLAKRRGQTSTSEAGSGNDFPFDR